MQKFNWLWPEKSHERWRETRKKGMAHFILFRGILGWGLPMLGIMHFAAQPQNHSLLFQIVLWLSAGACFGLCLWSFSERKFLKIENDQ